MEKLFSMVESLHQKIDNLSTKENVVPSHNFSVVMAGNSPQHEYLKSQNIHLPLQTPASFELLESILREKIEARVHVVSHGETTVIEIIH